MLVARSNSDSRNSQMMAEIKLAADDSKLLVAVLGRTTEKPAST